MKIHTTFVNFKYDAEMVELAHAWDEYCADSNYEGFLQSRAEQLASYGDDLDQVVYVDIEVPMSEVYARFQALTVRGDVSLKSEATP